MTSAAHDAVPRGGLPARVTPADRSTMAKGTCPKCDELHDITTTDQPVGRTGTAMRWRVSLHKKPGAIDALCDGSGALI